MRKKLFQESESDTEAEPPLESGPWWDLEADAPKIDLLPYAPLAVLTHERARRVLIPHHLERAISRFGTNVLTDLASEMVETLNVDLGLGWLTGAARAKHIAWHLLEGYPIRAREVLAFSWMRLAMCLENFEATLTWSTWFLEDLSRPESTLPQLLGVSHLLQLLLETGLGLATLAEGGFEPRLMDAVRAGQVLSNLNRCLSLSGPVSILPRGPLDILKEATQSLIDRLAIWEGKYPYLFPQVESARRLVPPKHGSGIKVLLKMPVFNSEDKISRGEQFKLLSSPVPLAPISCLDRCEEELVGEFPWLEAVIRAICSDLHALVQFGNHNFRLRPLLLVGPAGSGKTRLATRIAQCFNVPYRLLPVGGSSDNRALAGTARAWSSATPSLVLHTIADHFRGNPVIILDELDKVAESRHNGRIWDTLLAMTEQVTSSQWYDECLEVDCDLSAVSFVGTANSLAPIPAALLSRFSLHYCPNPSVEHLPTLLREIKRDVARQFRINPLWLEQITLPEPWLERPPLPSVRQIRSYIESELGARRKCETTLN
jgi:hypothetical protein